MFTEYFPVYLHADKKRILNLICDNAKFANSIIAGKNDLAIDSKGRHNLTFACTYYYMLQGSAGEKIMLVFSHGAWHVLQVNVTSSESCSFVSHWSLSEITWSVLQPPNMLDALFNRQTYLTWSCFSSIYANPLRWNMPTRYLSQHSIINTRTHVLSIIPFESWEVAWCSTRETDEKYSWFIDVWHPNS